MKSAGNGLAAAASVVGLMAALVVLSRDAGRSTIPDGEEGDHPDWVGRPAPPLVVRSVSGETTRLDRLRGRPVVLVFWATWCAACRRELPHLERLAREEPDVTILGLSEEPEATLRAFADKRPLDFRIASVPQAPAPFDGVRAIPTNVFIDRRGVIREVRVASMAYDDLRAKALAPDHAGTPTPAARSGSRGMIERWSADVARVTSLATCDWDGDGTLEVAAAANGTLHVLDATGIEKARVGLPDQGSRVDCTRLRDGSVRVLAYETWSPQVAVVDGLGRALWSYRAERGVDGARWGDLDGDRVPEMVVGMNGKDGLHAVSLDGRRIWHVRDIENVWNLVVLPAGEGRDARIVVTEQSGWVHVFDGRGKRLGRVRPMDVYYSPVAAIRAPGDGLQILAASETMGVAFDAAGTVAWTTALPPRPRGTWSWPLLAAGDLTGDGAEEWVFAARDAPRTLEVRSPAGRTLTTLELEVHERVFDILTTQGKGLLVVASDKVRAYAIP